MLRTAVSRRLLSCGCRQSSSVCVESVSNDRRRVCCCSYYVESDNDAVDRRRSHFVIVRFRGGLGLVMDRYYSLKL